MPETPKDLIFELHKNCGDILRQSFLDDRESQLSSRYIFIDQLHLWDEALHGRLELKLFSTAQNVYAAAILNACQGQYRNSFKNIRLTLELYLQGILLSADEISLREWLGNMKDTNWSLIIDTDKGVFSSRFVSAFYPGLSDRRKNFESMSRALYRELSECTHGNESSEIVIPRDLVFSEDLLHIFLLKCDTLRLVIHFSLCLRYLLSLTDRDLRAIEGFVLEELGHLPTIRSHFGGAV